MRISHYSEKDINFLKRILLKKIEVIDLESIVPSTWAKDIELVKDVDEFDAPFIALSLELDSPLWTGDKRLIKGMAEKGIDWVLNTTVIKEIRGEE